MTGILLLDNYSETFIDILHCFLARDVIYIHLAFYATMSVSVGPYLSVTEVHWRIIAYLGF